MAKSSLGKIVSRVGASGGGKTYAKSRPANYYGVLTIIVVLGLSAITYSRYERQHPVVISHAFPALGSVGYVALASEDCGVVLPYLPAYKIAGSLFHLQASNVLQATPLAALDAGNGATLNKFTTAYNMVIDARELAIPNKLGVLTKALTFKAGTTCAKGTKYAGQKAYPEIAYWRTTTAKTTYTTNPSSIVVSQYMYVTFAFDPKGVTPSYPSKATVTAMYNASTTTTTTTPPVIIPTTTTTVSSVTTTTVPVTTTTVPVTTTTNKK